MLNFFAEQTTFDNTYKALGTLGAIGTFLWTVYTWREKSRRELEASAADAERASRARIIEATKPFLERQLELYTVVTRAASVIATSDDQHEVEGAIKAFMQLFSGELALVENDDVSLAMQNFRRAIQSMEASNVAIPAAAVAAGSETGTTAQDAPQTSLSQYDDFAKQREGLLRLSLNLAQACRKSLAKSWHVDAWANPDNAA